ncbi:MAG TPA: hypothetical protein VG297_13085 [Bryobacteraceae bacterium]|jgi:hypothetical protein|nr:hypothetical protein [Bryobacteraceae bacterium]
MQRLHIVMVGLLAVSALAAQTSSKTPYRTPKTSWGDPDLQGVWPGNMGVPMQRPLNEGDRTTLTDEEFAKKQEQAKKQAAADEESTAASDSKVGIGPPSYWNERGKPTRQTSLIVDPPNGRLPDLTPEAVKYRKEARGGKGLPGAWSGHADSWEDLNIYYRCISRGLLGSVIPVVYNNGNQILQVPGYVVFRNEMIHESRVIPLDGRPHVNSAIKMYLGDSRGHWDGDTLVVETTNFTDRDAIGSNGAGYPGDPGYHSDQLKVTERFTRMGPKSLDYRITVDDPKTWVRPWTILIQLERNDNYQLLEYACHEGNYAMTDILSGAREAEAAKQTSK